MTKCKILAVFYLFYIFVCQSFAQAPANFFDSNNIRDNASTQQQMLRNIYLLTLLHENGGLSVCSSFRIHKNWLLTAAHCMYNFIDSDSEIYMRIEEKTVNPKIYGEKDFSMIINKPDSAHPANAKVFLYKQNYSENGSVGSHSDDIALIYVPNNAQKLSFSKFLVLSGMNKNILKQIPEVAVNQLKYAHKKLVDDSRNQFLSQSLNNDFNFFTLSEDLVIDELSPDPNKYSYALYKYTGDQNTAVGAHRVSKFSMFCNGTKRNTNMLYFYPDPQGGSGSPIFYGNIIVSIASGPDGLMSGPLLTGEFYNFLKDKMGGDYRQGMCISATQSKGNEIVIKVPVRRPTNPK
jgi:hypothetical protein